MSLSLKEVEMAIAEGNLGVASNFCLVACSEKHYLFEYASRYVAHRNGVSSDLLTKSSIPFSEQVGWTWNSATTSSGQHAHFPPTAYDHIEFNQELQNLFIDGESVDLNAVALVVCMLAIQQNETLVFRNLFSFHLSQTPRAAVILLCFACYYARHEACTLILQGGILRDYITAESAELVHFHVDHLMATCDSSCHLTSNLYTALNQNQWIQRTPWQLACMSMPSPERAVVEKLLRRHNLSPSPSPYAVIPCQYGQMVELDKEESAIFRKACHAYPVAPYAPYSDELVLPYKPSQSTALLIKDFLTIDRNNESKEEKNYSLSYVTWVQGKEIIALTTAMPQLHKLLQPLVDRSKVLKNERAQHLYPSSGDDGYKVGTMRLAGVAIDDSVRKVLKGLLPSADLRLCTLEEVVDRFCKLEGVDNDALWEVARVSRKWSTCDRFRRRTYPLLPMSFLWDDMSFFGTVLERYTCGAVCSHRIAGFALFWYLVNVPFALEVLVEDVSMEHIWHDTSATSTALLPIKMTLMELGDEVWSECVQFMTAKGANAIPGFLQTYIAPLVQKNSGNNFFQWLLANEFAKAAKTLLMKLREESLSTGSSIYSDMICHQNAHGEEACHFVAASTAIEHMDLFTMQFLMVDVRMHKNLSMGEICQRRTSHGGNMLHYACQSCHPEKMRFIIKEMSDGDRDVMWKETMTYLDLASSSTRFGYHQSAVERILQSFALGVDEYYLADAIQDDIWNGLEDEATEWSVDDEMETNDGENDAHLESDSSETHAEAFETDE